VLYNVLQHKGIEICCFRGIYQTVPIYGAAADVNRGFQEGQHYIEYKAVDEVGNFDQCSFTVIVRGMYVGAQWKVLHWCILYKMYVCTIVHVSGYLCTCRYVYMYCIAFESRRHLELCLPVSVFVWVHISMYIVLLSAHVRQGNQPLWIGPAFPVISIVHTKQMHQ